MQTNNESGKKLTCKHCRHTWEYKGKSEYWATCPKCRYQVNLKQHGRQPRKASYDGVI